MKRSLEDRFWAKVDKKTASPCWLWTGSKDKRKGKGYGKFWANGKLQQAHRVSWGIFCGIIPPGKVVCHHCDITNCVNPEHLFVGTSKDNMQDCAKKGRAAWGESHGGRKLPEAEVIAIFHAKGSCRQIAEAYGVSFQQVSRIKNGKRWAHLGL